MINRIKTLFSKRQIFKNMVLGELKARYAGSFLGISWVVITPFLIAVVISFVFTKIMKIDIEYFPLFILSAIFPWMCFSASLFDATTSIVRKGKLLSQFAIPREILPIASVAANFIKFFFGLLVMLPIFIIFKVKIIPFLLFLPIVILIHFIFTAGIGLLLSCVNVFLRDISYLLEVILMFWFWMTPVFYSVDMIPERFRWICLLNPMTSCITMYREILFEARIPAAQLLNNAIALSFITFVIGYTVFIKYEEYFLKKI